MTVSIHTRLESDTIHVPQAADLIGKDVRITIIEEPLEKPQKDMSAMQKLAGKIDLDWDAVDDLRRASRI